MHFRRISAVFQFQDLGALRSRDLANIANYGAASVGVGPALLGGDWHFANLFFPSGRLQ